LQRSISIFCDFLTHNLTAEPHYCFDEINDTKVSFIGNNVVEIECARGIGKCRIHMDKVEPNLTLLFKLKGNIF
jgi:hypothetical protein